MKWNTKFRTIKYSLLIMVLGIGTNGIGFSNGVFSDQDLLGGNMVTAGCWAAPEVPAHIYPPDGTIVGADSEWLTNPYLDWTDSTTTCPASGALQYQYESYYNEELTSLAYRSGWLNNSMIAAPGMADGDYYWRVRAFDGFTYSEWSAAWLLKVDRDYIEAGAGAVVINEIMWMGSEGKSDDEWIELRNMTGREIDLGGWKIENAKKDNGTYTIPSARGNVIPANGFFLIANYPSTSAKSALNVAPHVHSASLNFKNADNVNLALKDKGGNVIDEAKGDTWPKGSNGSPKKKSMERNDVPGDGTQTGSWHTCEDDDPDDGACNSGAFWDTDGGNNYGTPGAANLSANDPTRVDIKEVALVEDVGDGEEAIEEDKGGTAESDDEAPEEPDSPAPPAVPPVSPSPLMKTEEETKEEKIDNSTSEEPESSLSPIMEPEETEEEEPEEEGIEEETETLEGAPEEVSVEEVPEWTGLAEELVEVK